MSNTADAPHVFISHSSEDNVLAISVRDWLEKHGYRSFLDFEGIAGGAAWEKRIYSALDESVALILCVTPKSSESKWVWAEVLIARYRGIPVIPLLMQGSDIPDLLKHTTQAIDFTTDPTRGYEKLLKALKEVRPGFHRPRRDTAQEETAAFPFALRIVAGIGRKGHGVEPPARKEKVSYPHGVAVGSDGTIYFGNIQGATIHQLSPNGELSTFATGVLRPAQLAIDDLDDSLYAASIHRNAIQRIRLATGSVETVAGSSSEGDAEEEPVIQVAFRRPVGVAVSPRGDRIYVADRGNHRICLVSLHGGRVEVIAGNGTRGYTGDHGHATDAQLNEPSCLALDDGRGLLFFSDTGNHCVRQVRLEDGEMTTVIGTGQQGFSDDGTPANECMLDTPCGLALTPHGLFVVDCGNHRVRWLRADGSVITVAGTGSWGFTGDVRDARQAELFRPWGLAYDPGSDSLIVTDSGHGQIKVIGPRSRLQTQGR